MMSRKENLAESPVVLHDRKNSFLGESLCDHGAATKKLYRPYDHRIAVCNQITTT